MRDARACERGYSLIEILVASAIGISTVAAIYSAADGSQSSITSGELREEALSLASEVLSSELEEAQKDFNLVNPRALVVGAYEALVSVQERDDHVSKLVTSVVRYRGQYGQDLNATFSTIVTNLENVHAPDTCSSVLEGDWSAPLSTSVSLMSLIPTTTGQYAISDIDVLDGRAYISVAKTLYRSDPTLVILDVSDPSTVARVGSIDNASSINGLAASRVVHDFEAGKWYVFSASLSSFTAGQLQVFDVTDATLPSLLTTYKIPGLYVPSAGLGNALVYHDGFVYLGLTSNTGYEFNVVDVHTPSTPAWVGGYDLGSHDANAFVVRRGFAYVASPATEEVTVLDVAAAPYRVAGFNAPIGAGNGKSVYAVGDALYVGKTIPNAGPEWYALDISNPAGVQTANTSPANKEIGNSVNAILTRDSLSFALTNAQLSIFNATSGAAVATVPLPASGSTFEPSMDCEGNTLYITSNDSTHNGTLTIIASTPD